METGPGSDMENEEAEGQDRVSSGQGNTHPYMYTSVHGHAHTHEHSHRDHRRGGEAQREHVFRMWGLGWVSEPEAVAMGSSGLRARPCPRSPRELSNWKHHGS